MTNWDKRKRLEAAIGGAKVDRPPVALWRHWPGDDQQAETLSAAHLKWQQDYDWDLVKVSPPSSFCLVDWGVEDRWAGHPEGTRDYTRFAIHNPEDWANLAVLDPKKGMLATQIETLKLVGQGLGTETPFMATIFSPLAQAKNLAGQEKAIEQMRSQPDLFRRGLEIITESTLRYVEAAKATGISGIFYAIQQARFALLSPAEYQLFGRPYDEQILAAAGDLWLNMIHLHGKGVMFDMVADYEAAILNWHDQEAGISLASGLNQFGGAVSGGIARETVHLATPEAVTAEAKEALKQTAGQRFLLGTGCVIMTNSPLANIRAVRQAVA